ncbi:uncharacterized protein LOC110733167 [Chenopodium quinoa]|uniref:uncharacterized protein LOC110733167 n=1 Tax=Chenopodium quinoa TaxID=63459 RepID=UPI000B78C110|nr:uncharacterized protein LOC110733167 [Chenopodium quinoa]
MDFSAEPVDLVPIWVRMPGLNLKYWGQKALMKLASLIGKPIRTDKVTATKERLEYAQIMVEVKFNAELPECIEFLDELGNTVKQEVNYQWKPRVCRVCGGIGHDDAQCPNHKVQARKMEGLQAGKYQQLNKQKKKPQRVGKPIKKPDIQNQNNGNRTNTLNGGMQTDDICQRPQLVQSGLNKASKLCNVLWFIGHHGVGLFGLLETKLKAVKFGDVFNRFGSEWSVCANYCYHKGGRIWVVWLSQFFDVNVVRCAAQLIHIWVAHKATGVNFKCTMVYGLNTA